MSADLFAAFANEVKPDEQSHHSAPPQNEQLQSRPPKSHLPDSHTVLDVFATLTLGDSHNPIATSTTTYPTIPCVNTPVPPAPTSQSGIPSHRAPSLVQPPLIAGDDDWGDFETAPTSNAQPSISRRGSEHVKKLKSPPRDPLIRTATSNVINNTLVDLDLDSVGTTQPASLTLAPTIPKPQVVNSLLSRPAAPIRLVTDDFFNRVVGGLGPPTTETRSISPNHTTASAVMFDADDFELAEGDEDGKEEGGDDDDFGDFEVASPQPDLRSTKPATVSASIGDLLGLESPSDAAAWDSTLHLNNKPPADSMMLAEHISGSPVASQSPSWDSTLKKPTANQLGSRPQNTVNDRVANIQLVGQDNDEFPDWEHLEFPSPDLASPRPPATLELSEDWNMEPSSSFTVEEVQPLPLPEPSVISPQHSPGPPPTNVPPPSILLAALSSLLRAPMDALFKPSSKLDSVAKTALFTHPKTVQFLRGHAALAVVAGHILAGRRYRWTRDRLLASKMSVSQAGANGMKLTSVNKSESQNEAREASEVMETWKETVGLFRTACATSGTKIRVPELSSTLTVITTKGGLNAPKACVVCGLKRAERVPPVDVDVDDIFGEWWVEHWGHRSCRNFWIKQEVDLRSR